MREQVRALKGSQQPFGAGAGVATWDHFTPRAFNTTCFAVVPPDTAMSHSLNVKVVASFHAT